MSAKELRELDAWIAEHVFNAKRETSGWEPGDTYEEGLDCLVSEWQPTTDPAAAMAVFKKLLESHILTFESTSDGYCIEISDGVLVCCKTLELAICEAAKKLFSK